MPVQYDMNLIVHILSFLPSSLKAAVAKLVCKEAHRVFQNYTTIDSSCIDLPLACILGTLDAFTESEQGCFTATAAKHGDLHRLQALRDHGCHWDHRTNEAAAGAGHLAILQWIATQRPIEEWCFDVLHFGATHGQLDVLQWYASTLKSLYPDDTVDWQQLVAFAAHGGHLDILQWVHTEASPKIWTHQAMTSAAGGGQMHILQWLRAEELSCNWDEEACEEAAYGGHLDILQWLRALQPPCPWDSRVCTAAATRGHLELLQWALSQSPAVPWDDNACQLAIVCDQVHIMEWVVAQQPPLRWNRRSCMRLAEREGHQALVELLQALPDVAG